MLYNLLYDYQKHIVDDLKLKIDEKTPLSPEQELAKFQGALKNVKSALDKERHTAYGQKDREEILLAHITILEDPFLIEETKEKGASL